MSQTQSIALRQQSPADVDERGFQMISAAQESQLAGTDQVQHYRSHGSPLRGSFVLIGNGLLQLPIWGELRELSYLPRSQADDSTGFAMSYGVFQEYFSENWTLEGNQKLTGVIGASFYGVIYLAMPFLFAAFTKHWAHRRLTAALCGAVLMCTSFFLSSFSKSVWQLIATQGVFAPYVSQFSYCIIDTTFVSVAVQIQQYLWSDTQDSGSAAPSFTVLRHFLWENGSTTAIVL